MKRLFSVKIGIFLCAALLLEAFLYIAPTYVFSVSYSRTGTAQAIGGVIKEIKSAVVLPPPVTHVKTPDTVKGLYMTACVLGTPSLRDNLVHIADSTEINTFVIDIKDFSGGLSFVPSDISLMPYVSTRCKAGDAQIFINSLHAKNIYVIGRVTAFQDPLYTKLHPESAILKKSDGTPWKDKNGLAYIDPSSRDAWIYLEKIAQAAYDIGFDEINFDYVRYPSDGDVANMKLPEDGASSKESVMNSFFVYLHTALAKANITHSADFFGMTTTNTDDLGIGQVLEDGLRNFDYISPMVYPSHYPPTWNSYSLPDKYPYEVVNISMKKAALRAQAIGESPLKLRPWLQDFRLNGVSYTADMIKKEKQATYDAGLTSWLIWNASNNYTKGALEVDS